MRKCLVFPTSSRSTRSGTTSRETKEGHALLKPYGLAPVALLYGPHADDFKGMHDRIVTLLKSGNKSVVGAFSSRAFGASARSARWSRSAFPWKCSRRR